MVPDGILGLTPTFSSSSTGSTLATTGELFVTTLQKAGLIEKPIFSLFLGRTALNEQSKLHLGGWNESFILRYYSTEEKKNKTASELTFWFNITSKVYWQAEMNSVAILNSTGGQTFNFTTSVKGMVFDSGSTYTYIPTSDYAKILSAI